MNLKQLEIFIAIARTGSFSRGADMALLTQSTVSQHICALENECGVRLFDRTARGVLLTDGGKLLLEHAHRVLDEVRETEQALNRYRGATDVELVVGCSTTPADYLIPRVLPILAKEAPGITLTVLGGDSSEVLEMLTAGKVSVGVVGCRTDTDGIDFTPLCRDEIVLVVPPSHRWGSGNAIDVSELAGEPLILREPGSGTGKAVTDALTAVGITVQPGAVRARLASGEAIKRAVIEGVGGAFVSGRAVRDEVRRNELRVVPVHGLAITRKIYLAVRSGREQSPAAATFCTILRKLLDGE